MPLDSLSDQELDALIAEQQQSPLSSMPDAQLDQMISEQQAKGPEVGFFEGHLINAGRGIKNTLDGVGQAYRSLNVAASEESQQLGGPNLGVPRLPRVPDEQLQAQRDDLENFNLAAVMEKRTFEESPAAQVPGAFLSELAAEAASTAFVPGGATGGLGRRIAAGAASNAGVGASQFVEEDSSRLANAAIGGIGGAVLPGAETAVRGVVSSAKEALGGKTADRVGHLVGEEVAGEAQKRLRATDQLNESFEADLRLTPAEASGDPVLAARQGRTGVTSSGEELNAQQAAARLDEEKKVIRNFLRGVSPLNGRNEREVQAGLKDVLGAQQAANVAAAQPFYELAYQDSLSKETFERLMQNKVLSSELDRVLNTPAFQQELGGAARESIHTLDILKQSLDDRIARLLANEDRSQARIFQKAKTDLINAADKASPIYREARGIFEQATAESEVLMELSGDVAGRGAVKTATQRFFDPNQNPKELEQVARRLYEQDPDIYRQALRNEFQRRLDSVRQDATGTTFFKQILQKDRDFRMFLAVTKVDPGSRKALVQMRRVFQDLINPQTPAGAGRLAAGNIDQNRNVVDAMKDLVANIAGGRYDRAGIEIITNPRWYESLDTLASKSVTEQRTAAAALLARVNATLLGD